MGMWRGRLGGAAALHPLLRRLFLKCTGTMWGEGCVQPGWEGFGMLVGPSAPLPGIGELLATGVYPNMQGHSSSERYCAVECTQWGCGRALGKHLAPLGVQGPVPGFSGCLPSTLSSQLLLFSPGGCMPSSPEPRPAPSFLQPLPASAPGQLWANSPWHFPPGEQPLQPGTLVSSWQHSLGEFGLEMFVLGCWRVLDFVFPGRRML